MNTSYATPKAYTKTAYDYFIERKQREYGDKFDSSALSKQFIHFFNTGQRIEVDFGYEVKRGRIGVTTGWKPCFLLMLRRDSISSAYTLSDDDKITKVIS